MEKETEIVQILPTHSLFSKLYNLTAEKGLEQKLKKIFFKYFKHYILNKGTSNLYVEKNVSRTFFFFWLNYDLGNGF